MTGEPIICVHKMNGHPAFVRVGRDRVLLSKRPIVVERENGDRFEVKETRREIEGFLQDCKR